MKENVKLNLYDYYIYTDEYGKRHIGIKVEIDEELGIFRCIESKGESKGNMNGI